MSERCDMQFVLVNHVVDGDMRRPIKPNRWIEMWIARRPHSALGGSCIHENTSFTISRPGSPVETARRLHDEKELRPDRGGKRPGTNTESSPPPGHAWPPTGEDSAGRRRSLRRKVH
ncbi:uncharacterized protein LOC125028168 [Penaeus chinensis]|uniref:uncharacterized protein LOC125028168 n=1 Tax=Penaeus chinensis TaxID=139456 RepID=UPI001FB72EAE|nr:uncharacterized protein LOC125028168 [Penaeus chinensis]